MTTSFHSLNYPSHTFGYMNKHRISQYSVRTNPALAIPPSSVLLQSDESGNLLNSKKIPGSNTSQNSVCNSLLNQDNIVGIIGGVSIDSTLNFLNKLVRWSTKEGDDCPPFVLCSDPVLRKNEFLNRDCAPMENLRRKRVFLEKSGARCVVMPCHVSHSWHDEVSRGCSVPFLHMGECVARELKEANLRPVERGSPLRIGVLATVATLKAGFYQEKLQNEGFEVVVPDKATMEHTVIPAAEAFYRKDMEGARNLLRIALQVLLLRAVNTVILASDDLRELLPHDDPLLKKCVDPLDALARSTIKWTLSAGKVAAYSLFDQEPLDHVHQCYSKATYLKTYDNMLAPLNGKELWTTSLTQVMLPPDVCRRAGRPKKARRREPEEEATVPPDPTKLGRKGTKMTCSKCGVQGHNKRSCKTKEPVREQSAPVDEMAEQSAHGTSGVVQERANAAMGSGIKLPKTKPKRASKLTVRRQMNKTKHNQVEQNKGLTLSQPQSQVDDPVPS